MSRWLLSFVCVLIGFAPAGAADYLPGRAYKIPSQYTNQESGYFSIVEGLDGKVYIGSAKYGVNAYLLAFDPKAKTFKMVVDVHKVIGSNAKGFAAQAKIHTRNNVGKSGKIYFASKQGYPEKGEKRSDYLGGYAFAHDPKTGVTEHFGVPIKHHGIISIIPDEKRGVAYVSTCTDDRPLEHSHFMVLDLKKKTYRDLGDMEHLYAFIVLDDQGRAYHPIRGGQVARFDPDTNKLERLTVTVDGKPAPAGLTKESCILNWETSPDRKTLYAIEMTTNELFAFDLTGKGKNLAGKSLGKLVADAKRTDCRALCVGTDGTVWATVSDRGRKGGSAAHLVSYRPGAKAPRDHGVVSIANPDFTTFVDDKGKPKPWHHTIRKEKDGAHVPWQPLGICAARDGNVYVLTLAPFTLIQYTPQQLK